MKLSTAQSLVNNALAFASAQQQSIAVAITDSHGELLHYARMDDCAFHAGVLAQNKAYTAARDRQSTASLAAWAQATGKGMGYWSDPKFTGIQGGIPLVANEVVVGAIGISGLSEAQDHALAQRVIDSHAL